MNRCGIFNTVFTNCGKISTESRLDYCAKIKEIVYLSYLSSQTSMVVATRYDLNRSLFTRCYSSLFRSTRLPKLRSHKTTNYSLSRSGRYQHANINT